MNTRTSYALIAVLAAVGTLTISPAFGAFSEKSCPDCPEDGDLQKAVSKSDKVPVTVKTDRTTYNHDSVIKVTGEVSSPNRGTPVTLTVTSPSNNIVTVEQIMPDSDGMYSATLSTAGSLWKYDGTYTIRVQYGPQSVNNKAVVTLTGAVIPTVECAANELSASGHCIPYSITGGTVTGASINTQDKSVIVKISSTDSGSITLTPSNKIISGIFLVLVDGEEWDDATITGNEVTVMFPAGTEEIEIIGTFVIPEFGTIAALILAVAIISIIAVSARTRLSLMPKY